MDNMFVFPPKFIWWNPKPQWDGKRRCGLWDVNQVMHSLKISVPKETEPVVDRQTLHRHRHGCGYRGRGGRERERGRFIIRISSHGLPPGEPRKPGVHCSLGPSMPIPRAKMASPAQVDSEFALFCFSVLFRLLTYWIIAHLHLYSHHQFKC